MKSKHVIFFLLLSLIFLSVSCKSQNKQIDRQPAFAGQFYPSDPDELKANLANYFSSAVHNKNIKNVLAVICPHAGYVFSGEVAASSYNQIDPEKKYENIFILGISHRIGFEGASVYNAGDYITPLGRAKVNIDLANELISKSNLFSSRTDAHIYEHSVEVQIPFLQFKLKKDFKIIPIVLGANSPSVCEKIAEVLKLYFNSRNLFVISTDFSHYPKYKDAVQIDKLTAQAVLMNSPKKLLQVINENENKSIPNLVTCMCGEAAVLTLLYMTENNPNIKVNLIEYKNSGDSQYGDKNQVVGYNSIVFSLNSERSKKEFNLNEKDKIELLKIARSTIKQYVNYQKVPEVDEKNLSENAKTECGAFVTLKENGELRGCIGRFDANEPLYRVIQQMAVASSTQDYRFLPVKPAEVGNLEIEISVLTPMKKITSIDEIELGKHGIYIRKGMKGGTFLPQVAAETGWTKEEFLGHCAQDKAGIGWNGWKDADIYIYEALVFSENEFIKK